MAKKKVPEHFTQGNTLLKLNLGCGTDHRESWVNIDAVADVKPDLLHDLHEPLPFPDHSVNQVLAQDILEHFTKEDAQKVIAEIGRVLEIGGTVEVRVPNVDEIIERFSQYKETRNEFLYGTTFHTGIFGAHKVGYTPEMMVRFMMEHGLELKTLELEETNFHFVFEKVAAARSLRSLVFFGKVEQDTTEVVKTTLEQLRQQGTNVRWIDLNGLRSYWNIFMELFRNPPQLVLFSSLWPQVFGTVFAVIMGTSVVWLEEKGDQAEINRWFKMPRLFYYLVKDLPETVLATSDNVKSNLTRRHVPLELLHVIALSAKDGSTQLAAALRRAFWKSEARRVAQRY